MAVSAFDAMNLQRQQPAFRSLAAVVLLAMLIAITGCSSPSSTSQETDEARAGDATPRQQGSSADANARETSPQDRRSLTPRNPADLPTPPGVDRAQLMVRSGDALTRARMPYDQIIASQPASSKLIPESSSAATTDASTEPAASPERDSQPLSRDAQLAYIAGRMALSEGQMQQAVFQLKRALALTPTDTTDHAQIANLLAQCYLRLGNTPAATIYLQQALRDDTADLDTLIKLGRVMLQRNDWQKALVLFDRALVMAKALEPASPSLIQLCQFHLGGALEVGGYDKASSEYYIASMRGSSASTDHPAARYQMMVIARQFPALHQTVGDALLRLGQPREALQAYQRVNDDTLTQQRDWLARMVYTHLLLGDTESATELVVDKLGQGQRLEDALPLVQYLIEQGGSRDALAMLLERSYRDAKQQTSSLAVLISRLLPAEKARSFLQDHLAENPQDQQVFDALLGLVMTDPPEQGASDANGNASRLAAIDLVAGMIEKSPTQAEFFTQRLMHKLQPSKTGDADEAPASANADAAGLSFAELIATRPEAWQRRPVIQFMLAGALLSDSPAQAYKLLSELHEAQPPFAPASMLLARQLASGDHWDMAMDVLKDVQGRAWQDQADALRLQILQSQRKNDQALLLVTAMLLRQPSDLDLLLTQAHLQQRTGQATLAQRTLLDLLNEHPRDERIYDLLLKIYDAGDVADVTTQYQRLMLRLFDTMPESRIAQLQQAQLLALRREFAQAQQILRNLLRTNPLDIEALGRLASLYRMMNQPQEADSLIESSVANHRDSQTMLFFAAEYFQAVQNPTRSFELLEAALSKIAHPSDKAYRLAVLYLRWNRTDAAIDQAQQALASQPIDPGQVLGVLFYALGQKIMADPASGQQVIDEATRVLEQSLERYPEQAADIHYSMSSFYTRLEQHDAAEAQLELALKKNPQHPESNNALGYQWADRGVNLQRAEKMIQIALADEPDSNAYLDSLGWVYYKLGRFDEAIHWLSQAAAAPGAPSAVILDHLGDAQFRAGQRRQALETWRQAQRVLETSPASNDPETQSLPGRLRAKIDAATTTGQVPVAPLGEKTATQSQ